MTVLINASNTSGLTITSDTSGNIALQSQGTTVATISSTGANAGIQLGGTFAPAFSASNSSNQSISANVFTKVTLDTEEFDTNNNFASSRFTPTVAGYYQFNGVVVTPTASQIYIAALFKNGAEFKRGNDLRFGSNQGQMSVVVNALIYMNGSTDYVELYAYINQNGTLTGNSAYGCYLQGFLARSA